MEEKKTDMPAAKYDGDMIVAKSSPLIWGTIENGDKTTLKFLDLYLGMIDPTDPSSGDVYLAKKDFCRIAGISPTVSLGNLNRALKKLGSMSVNYASEDAVSRSVAFLNIFEIAEAKEMKGSRETVIHIRATRTAEQLFFNLTHYQKTVLKNVIGLKTANGRRLYWWMIDKNFGNHEWIIKTMQLREMLGCIEPYYDEFKRFNSKIIKPMIDDVNRNSDLSIGYSYDRMRDGNHVLHFGILNELPSDTAGGQDDVSGEPEDRGEAAADEMQDPGLQGYYEYYREALNDPFTDAQIDELLNILMPETKAPYRLDETARNGIRNAYLRAKAKDNVKSIPGMTRFFLRNDYPSGLASGTKPERTASEAVKRPRNRFHTGSERQYTEDELSDLMTKLRKKSVGV